MMRTVDLQLHKTASSIDVRYIRIALPLLSIAFLESCNSSKEKLPDIAVGMTYDEVEEVLGKPRQIVRGANQLQMKSIDDLTFDQLADLDLDSAKVANAYGDSLVWGAENIVQTIGELIYVTWVFERSEVDTFHVFKKSFREWFDTVNIISYYLDERKVDKRIYQMAKIGDYLTVDDEGQLTVTTFGGEDKGKYYLGATRIDKKFSRPELVVTNDRVRQPSIREYYLVNQLYCVVFDASSGRVVFSGFQPFSVQRIGG